jgi:histone-lysine N-methyltransferase SETD1
MVVEYVGEVTSLACAEHRQAEYIRQGCPDYLFRLDQFDVVDATVQGGVARYLNHSCAPNCWTRRIPGPVEEVWARGARALRVCIYALRDIVPGEELTYDYKFERETDPGKRVPCHCGAATCSGYMN